jgi:hypothetical protein
MAKKDAPNRPIRPKTAGDYLARLRQFETRPIPFADLQAYDVGSGSRGSMTKSSGRSGSMTCYRS